MILLTLYIYNHMLVNTNCKVGNIFAYSIKKYTIVENKGIQMKKIFTPCPVETTLRLLENKWRVLIIRDLMTGTHRFGELQRSIGNISQRSLTMNLRFLEEYGLIKRRVYPEVPPRVEYSLTNLGLSLKPVLSSMAKWGNVYKANNK